MRWAAIAMVLLLVAGCERRMRDMYEQPRYDPGEASTLWQDGKASRPPPPGSVAHAMGDLAATSSGRRGDQQAPAPEAGPPPLTLPLLERGQQRYTIYCLPCHSPLGDGDGPVVRHGFPRPPSYHEDRLRSAPDRHFYDVITHGYGVMVPYADRVTPEDRWAIVAYVRALQLSQHAPYDTLPRRLQAAVQSASAASGPS